MRKSVCGVLLVFAMAVPALGGDEPKPLHGEKHVSLVAEGRDLREVIAEIVEGAGSNVILSPQVKGKVSVRLDGVTWREALEQVAESQGFAVVEEDYGILRVLPRAEVEVEELHYRFRNLRPGAADGPPDLVAALARLARPGCTLTWSAEENAMLVRGRKRQVQALAHLLAALDQAPAAPDAGAPESVAEVGRYEEMLRDCRTETAAQYFVEQLGRLRAQDARRRAAPDEASRRATAQTQMRGLERAIDAFRMQNKKLPGTLSALTETDGRNPYPFVKRIPQDPWGHEYEYRLLDRRTWQLRSYGADGVPDTEDDLVWPE